MQQKEIFYQKYPELRDYFDSLSGELRDRILQSGVEISTLGELKKVAEHFELMDKI